MLIPPSGGIAGRTRGRGDPDARGAYWVGHGRAVVGGQRRHRLFVVGLHRAAVDG